MGFKLLTDTGIILKTINRALIVIIIVVVIVGIRGLILRSTPFSIDPVMEKTRIATNSHKPDTIQDLSYYLSIVGKQQLFKKDAQPDFDRSARKIQRLTVQQLAASLTLVGIIDGEEPVALIIDNRTKKEYSLKVNEYINELLIKEITNYSVILTYEDESLELKL
jgi:hypothetical protein